MKLLDKRKIDIAKSQEKKLEIDTGMALARRVDALREANASEEKKLREYREVAVKEVQEEIEKLERVKSSLNGDIKMATETRQELLKPLNKEWFELREAQAELTRERETIKIDREELELDKQKGRDEWAKLLNVEEQIKANFKESEKIKNEAKSLHKLANQEYEKAKEERATQRTVYSKAMAGLAQTEEEYAVALRTIAIREHAVQDKEAELISREKHLASQVKELRQALKK